MPRASRWAPPRRPPDPPQDCLTGTAVLERHHVANFVTDVHVHFVRHAQGQLDRGLLVHLGAHHAPVLVVDGEAVLGTPLRNLGQGTGDTVSSSQGGSKLGWSSIGFPLPGESQRAPYILVSEARNYPCLRTELLLVNKEKNKKESAGTSKLDSQMKERKINTKNKIKIFLTSAVSEKTNLFTNYFLLGYKKAPSKIRLLISTTVFQAM